MLFHRLSLLPSDFEGKRKVGEWLGVLDSMQASDELSETQVRSGLQVQRFQEFRPKVKESAGCDIFGWADLRQNSFESGSK